MAISTEKEISFPIKIFVHLNVYGPIKREIKLPIYRGEYLGYSESKVNTEQP